MRNKYIHALQKTALTCVSVHLVLLLLYAIINRRIDMLNLFNILDIELFYPQASKGIFSFLSSYLLVGGMYFFYLKRGLLSKHIDRISKMGYSIKYRVAPLRVFFSNLRRDIDTVRLRAGKRFHGRTK